VSLPFLLHVASSLSLSFFWSKKKGDDVRIERHERKRKKKGISVLQIIEFNSIDIVDHEKQFFRGTVLLFHK